MPYSATPAPSIGLRPKRSASGPQISWVEAKPMKYATTTYWRWFSWATLQRLSDGRQRRNHRVDREGVQRHQPGEHHGHLARAGALHAVMRHGFEHPRLLAHGARPCNSGSCLGDDFMTAMRLHRRTFIWSAGALAASMTLPLGRVMAQAAEELPKIPIPSPISSAERFSGSPRRRH